MILLFLFDLPKLSKRKKSTKTTNNEQWRTHAEWIPIVGLQDTASPWRIKYKVFTWRRFGFQKNGRQVLRIKTFSLKWDIYLYIHILYSNIDIYIYNIYIIYMKKQVKKNIFIYSLEKRYHLHFTMNKTSSPSSSPNAFCHCHLWRLQVGTKTSADPTVVSWAVASNPIFRLRKKC